MNQSSDKPSSDAVDCSEAMEAMITDAALAIYNQFIGFARNHPVSAIVTGHDGFAMRIRISAMVNDADESSVQKTHPENQISNVCPYCSHDEPMVKLPERKCPLCEDDDCEVYAFVSDNNVVGCWDCLAAD